VPFAEGDLVRFGMGRPSIRMGAMLSMPVSGSSEVTLAWVTPGRAFSRSISWSKKGARWGGW